jgi:hypothetical protein
MREYAYGDSQPSGEKNTMLDLDKAIRERHSTRLFLPQPVPRELVNEALALVRVPVERDH